MNLTTTEILLLLAILLLIAGICLLIVLLARQGRSGETGSRQINELGNALLDELETERNAAAEAQLRMQEHLLSQLNGTFLRQDQQLEMLRATVQSSFAQQRESNDRQLAEIRHTVDEKLTTTLDQRLNESFQLVSKRLEEVYRGIGEMHEMANGISALKKVLTNVKNRGIWGEKQLGALIESVLSETQYAANVEVVPGSGEHVEYAIRLPGRSEGTVWLPVDSKFPTEAYERLLDAIDNADKKREETCRKELRRAILQEAKRITKYIRLPYSTDFAVMFLPVEGLYAEVVRTASLTDELQRDFRIVIAGPTTFTALLNSLQMGFRTLAIEQRSAEVWQLLGSVRRDFGRFHDALSKARTQLNQVGDTLDEAFRSTGKLQRELNALSEDAPELPEKQSMERSEQSL